MMSQTTTTITNILGEQLQEQEDNSTANSKDTQWVTCKFGAALAEHSMQKQGKANRVCFNRNRHSKKV